MRACVCVCVRVYVCAFAPMITHAPLDSLTLEASAHVLLCRAHLAWLQWCVQVLPNNAKLNHNFAHATTDPVKKEYHYRAAIYIYPPYGTPVPVGGGG